MRFFLSESSRFKRLSLQENETKTPCNYTNNAETTGGGKLLKSLTLFACSKF